MEKPSTNGKPNASQAEVDERQASVKERIDNALHRTADSLDRAADRLQGYAERTTFAGHYTERAASSLRSGARKLDASDTESLIENSANLVRRHPLASLAVAFGTGFLIARLIRGRF